MKFHRGLLRIVLLVVTVCGAAWAQDTGSITGTVKDPSGAAVPNAAVTVASPDHGINRETVTNSSGDYNESALPGGNYDVIVVAPGFKKFQVKGVVLSVAEKARVDVDLQVGAATTEVLVQGENVAQVETQSWVDSDQAQGTLDYCSPEQRFGLRTSARSDVFSLAVLTY